MKKIISVFLLVFFLVSCGIDWTDDSETVAQKEEEYQGELMLQAQREVGNPNITEFYEKKLAKEIFEKRDDSSLICYVYNQNLEGKYVYVGRSMGYGLPYSTQYTNPERKEYGSSGNVTLPQADPNGLYSATGLSATWLMMIDDETGENYIMYCEPTIVVTENKLPVRLLAEWSLTTNY